VGLILLKSAYKKVLLFVRINAAISPLYKFYIKDKEK
jgi:hypothetical protein